VRPIGRRLFVVVSVCWASLSFAAVHVTCRDGGKTATLERGNVLSRYPLCDLDAACDGVCTFSFQPACLSCYLNLTLSPGPVCSPDASEVCAPAIDPAPCPPRTALYAVALTGAKPRTRVVRFPRDGRIARSVVVLRCLPAKREHCATTTTTTLSPGLPDLTGDWTLTETTVSGDCPPGLTEPVGTLLHDHPEIGILQTGNALEACGDGIVQTAGELSPSSFSFDTGMCCGRSDATSMELYDFSQRLSGQLPGPGGVISVMGEWNFKRDGSPPGGASCTRTSQALLVRSQHACQTNADCIAIDPCLRCAAGSCTHITACW
jgi:hypothetical protein